MWRHSGRICKVTTVISFKLFMLTVGYFMLRVGYFKLFMLTVGYFKLFMLTVGYFQSQENGSTQLQLLVK
jgi:hypothetical protein